ncbi:hypothetical protein INR49_010797 [Caranx melampygus]|nr:hypothetical protein INR49_010797 [Caranx melampygus]
MTTGLSGPDAALVHGFRGSSAEEDTGDASPPGSVPSSSSSTSIMLYSLVGSTLSSSPTERHLFAVTSECPGTPTAEPHFQRQDDGESNGAKAKNVAGLTLLHVSQTLSYPV